MSWFARSLVNSFTADDDDEHGGGGAAEVGDGGGGEEEEAQPGTPGHGVKEDISELTRTLTRQFWGVASFLAPPPPVESAPPSSSGDPAPEEAPAADPQSPRLQGIRGDLADIGGRFKSGISMLSNSKAVSEISKIATNFLRELEADGDEDDGGADEMAGVGAAGVTEEVVAFARSISMHPETWLNFPLLSDVDNSGDFVLTDVQQEHVSAVEYLAPNLAALRIDLCPSHISEGCFWKIYFVLLHPRLNLTDAELLSTPQIMEARMMLQALQQPTNQGSTPTSDFVDAKVITEVPKEDQQTESGVTSTELPIVAPGFSGNTDYPVTDKRPVVQSSEISFVDKSVVVEGDGRAETKDLPGGEKTPAKLSATNDEEEDADGWLEDDAGDIGTVGTSSIPAGKDDDVSFSDLEEDDDQGSSAAAAAPKGAPAGAVGQRAGGSRGGWVQLREEEEKGSGDWLDIEDMDAL